MFFFCTFSIQEALTFFRDIITLFQNFQQLADTYPGDVSVVAIHGNLVTEDVDAYLARQPYTMPFALDDTGAVLTGLGGSMMLPQTVIIDRSGVITYNRVGSMDWAALEAQIVPLL